MHSKHNHSVLTKMILLTLLLFSILTGFKYSSTFEIEENYLTLCELNSNIDGELI